MPKTKMPKILFLIIFLAVGFLAVPKTSQAYNVFQLFSNVRIFQGQSVQVFRPWVCGTDTVTYGGQAYQTALIGTQCWFKENLNVGTMLASGSTMPSDPFDYNNPEKWCYGNNATNNGAGGCSTGSATGEGGLYTWAEMMGLPSACNTSNTGECVASGQIQGICPTGWHIPTDAEYMTMEEYLGMCSGAGAGCSGATGSRGTDQGSKLAGNFALWSDGNLRNNANFGLSGFTGLPAGYRDTGGSFTNRGYSTAFWSASQYSATIGWYRELYYFTATVYRGGGYAKAFGFSVRCLKN